MHGPAIVHVLAPFLHEPLPITPPQNVFRPAYVTSFLKLQNVPIALFFFLQYFVNFRLWL
jgi:hypothetical protein